MLEAGSLTQDGGRIVLTAGNDINLGAASTVAVDGQKGGEITVQAQAGTLLADGSITARGAGGTGGTVQLLGHQVGLVNAAQVDASGATGGGTVLVGGDYQGGNAAVQNAFRTYVARDVDDQGRRAATGRRRQGHRLGGRHHALLRQHFSAMAPVVGGNGGFVETSGKATLDARAASARRALADGMAGTWLLDPDNITIQDGPDSNTDGATPNFILAGDAPSSLRAASRQRRIPVTALTLYDPSRRHPAGNISVARPTPSLQ